MTSAPQRFSALRRWLSLRALLLLLFLAAALYAGALPVYLFFRIGSAASQLAHGTRSVVAVLEDFTRRNDAADGARELARRVLTSRGPPPAAALDSISRIAAQTSERFVPPDAAAVPPNLRPAIARADSQLSQIAVVLREAVTLIATGARGAAGERLALVDSLNRVAEQSSFRVAQLGRADLLARQAAVALASTEVRRDLVLWLVVGILLTWLGLFALQRRIWQPLAALEAGLTGVSEGDLNRQIPIPRMDETGRLAAHFNEMTRVLRNRAEEQGRFAAAGELLAGVAHEVNNPLMAIAAHAENRIADPETPADQREEMQQVLRQAQRATKLLRGLLRFVQATERRVVRVNLNDVVRGALDLVSFRFGVDEITVGGHLDRDLPPVDGDPIRLEQVLVNLLANAIDSLHAIKPPRRLTVDSWVENGVVCVAVGDSGPGVAADVAERLFHPFATTKGHSGTGLGLYVSRQIAREAGGDLVLSSGVGGGARFMMTLPPAAHVAATGGRPSGATDGTRLPESLAGVRMLIVDDEAPVRAPLVKFLKRRGAEVADAADGIEALSWLEQHDVDVIVADLRMPRMNGAELFAELQLKRPDLAARVLFLSGDVSQLAEPGSAPVPRERVLVKPVELGALEQWVIQFIAEQGVPR
jgi:signal transduction histidine kinase/CheY-like chemotaxis protein